MCTRLLLMVSSFHTTYKMCAVIPSYHNINVCVCVRKASIAQRLHSTALTIIVQIIVYYMDSVWMYWFYTMINFYNLYYIGNQNGFFLLLLLLPLSHIHTICTLRQSERYGIKFSVWVEWLAGCSNIVCARLAQKNTSQKWSFSRELLRNWL